MLYQSSLAKIALDSGIDGIKGRIHIEVVIVQTERAILHATGVGDILTLVY